MFQLCQRLECLKVYHPEDEGSTVDAQDAREALATDEVAKIEVDSHPDKPESGDQRICAHFRW